MKQLIVTADDVGLHRGMTEGALQAHRSGIVTACSLVANGREFEHAVELLRETPSLEVGVHLTVVEERALTTGQTMPRSWVPFVLFSHGSWEGELRAQIERVMRTGLKVTHLNGHQHLHLLPRLFGTVRQLGQEYGIPYIRRVNDRGGSASPARRLAIAQLSRLGRRAAASNDYTIGVLEAGRLADVEPLLSHVEGVTELVTHPGRAVDSYAHWGYQWERETSALCRPGLREAIAARGIQLVAPSAIRSITTRV